MPLQFYSVIVEQRVLVLAADAEEAKLVGRKRFAEGETRHVSARRAEVHALPSDCFVLTRRGDDTTVVEARELFGAADAEWSDGVVGTEDKGE